MLELNVDKPGAPLVVTRDLSYEEEEAGRLMVGPAGEMFDLCIGEAGFLRSELNITTVVPVRAPYDDFRKHKASDVLRGKAALDELVARLKPSLIITLGNEAAYHFVPGWPTGGREIYGAKGIENRRGYFWESKYGWVLTLMHPESAARKIVPGYELLRRDFMRAKRWLRGKLPRQEFPDVITVNASHVNTLLNNQVLAFDIETKWDKVYCCGFCGDDMQPYVAKFGQGFELMHDILVGREGLIGVAHNGQYDADLLDRDGYPTSLYTDDTQTAWGNALEPELAFRDEEGGKLTRKGLAALASLHPGLNVPFWKDDYPRYGHPNWVSGYPDQASSDPDETAKLYTMAGRDCFVTRALWDWLSAEMAERNVEEQYRLAFDTNLCCITMTRRGWKVDNKLRKERMKLLEARSEQAKEESAAIALEYIKKHDIEDFKTYKQCKCCGGGKVAREQCWRCAGFSEKPTKKDMAERLGDDNSTLTKKELEALLLDVCTECWGLGVIAHWEFNPFSGQQLKRLLYDEIGAPKWVWRGKARMDEMATIRLMLWAEGKS